MIVSSCKRQKENNVNRMDLSGWPKSFGFGRHAGTAEIISKDIDVRPDGKGLPEGSGNATTGKIIYIAKCAYCHGKTGVEGPYSRLVGTVSDTLKVKTIGNYWPYATTIFDYIRRAMPLDTPGSLSSIEVYSVTAFLLASNKIIDSDVVINAKTLPGITMPAKKFFVPDDRRGGPEIR